MGLHDRPYMRDGYDDRKAPAALPLRQRILFRLYLVYRAVARIFRRE